MFSDNLISKSDAGYVHWENTQYQCSDCPMWLEGDMCLLMSPSDVVENVDSCNYFLKGLGRSFGFVPLSFVGKTTAGWAHNEVGYSCKRCEHWDPVGWACSKVNKDSKGLDFSLIHPDACCNLWEKDQERGDKKDYEFYSFS